MIPNTGQVYTQIRSILNDLEVTGGQVFTNTRLLAPLNLAWDRLISELVKYESSFRNATAHIYLPAYYGTFSPKSFGLVSIGRPLELKNRPVISTSLISNIIPDTTGRFVTVTTSAAHNRTTGDKVDVVEVTGLDEVVNSSWLVTVVDSVTLKLNGCPATGTYNSGTGIILYSTQSFGSPMIKVEHPTDIPSVVVTNPTCWSYSTSLIWVQPSSNAIEYQLTYQLGDTDIPTGDTIILPIDGCANFLAFQTSFYALAGKTESPKLKLWQAEAERELQTLLSAAVKDQQTNDTRIIPIPFGTRPRSIFPIN
jgi:hypothetical protein